MLVHFTKQSLRCQPQARGSEMQH